MSLVEVLVHKHPELKKKLRIAKIDKTPKQFIADTIRRTAMGTIFMTIMAFFVFSNHRFAILIIPTSIILSLKIIYDVNLKIVDMHILKRGKDIDREVLFAGRFLLIKLNSGQPLINAIFEASMSWGVANKYFKEIVRDIELGTPLEEALDNAAKNSASAKFRRILYQISGAMKTGVDVTRTLTSILDEIASDQLIEIQRYGKKLNSITMFYMLLAIILPSLGMTMTVVLIGMMSELGSLSKFIFLIFGSLLIILNLIFLSMFKGARPNVNI